MTAVAGAARPDLAVPSAREAPRPDGGAQGAVTDRTAGGARIREAFARAEREGRAALVPYVVAGYPDLDGSLAAAVAAVDAGADILEVGLPYSDPLADGATLQRASSAALRAGATLERSLTLLERIAAARPGIPLVPMGYANQLIGGGDGAALARRLAGAGASGVIVADLTPDEGMPFERSAADAGLAVVYLVAPTTPRERVAFVAGRTGGFLYCVSLVGVTGARTSLPSSVGRLIRGVAGLSPVPVAVGFGVSRPAHVRALVRAGAHGVIVASALVDSLGRDGRDIGALARLVASLRAATVLPPAGRQGGGTDRRTPG
ncbi:MAG TPA: tryptophan synthase subunit alpha [Candidatus Dormibacteraeota bacterium]|nr:tryptophan synthase subunit alpha [Candidatus Dormibacteraeota bacterium]